MDCQGRQCWSTGVLLCVTPGTERPAPVQAFGAPGRRAEPQLSYTVPFERLNSSNWGDWRRRMRAWLEAKGLWECTQDPPFQAGPWEDAAARAAASAAQRRDKKAVAYLLSATGKEQAPHIDKLSAHDIWQLLEQMNYRNTAAARIHAMKHLSELRLQPGGDVRDHVKRVVSVLNCLRQLSVPFSAKQQVYMLLSTLDESYETLCLSLGADQFNLDFVSGLLCDEHDRRQREKSLAAKGGCLAPRSEGPFGNTEITGSALASKACFRCGSYEHLRRDCPHLFDQEPSTAICTSNRQTARRSRGGNRGPPRGGRDAKPRYCHAAALLAWVGKREKHCKQLWIIDSGASHHIAVPSAVHLQNCWEIEAGKTVTLADSSKKALKTAGFVFMPCLHAELEVYVLEGMKTCLLSVSALDRDGFRVCFENQVCTISRGGKTLFQVESKNGLYVLESGNDTTEGAQAQGANVAIHDQCLHLCTGESRELEVRAKAP